MQSALYVSLLDLGVHLSSRLTTRHPESLQLLLLRPLRCQYIPVLLVFLLASEPSSQNPTGSQPRLVVSIHPTVHPYPRPIPAGVQFLHLGPIRVVFVIVMQSHHVPPSFLLRGMIINYLRNTTHYPLRVQQPSPHLMVALLAFPQHRRQCHRTITCRILTIRLQDLARILSCPRARARRTPYRSWISYHISKR